MTALLLIAAATALVVVPRWLRRRFGDIALAGDTQNVHRPTPRRPDRKTRAALAAATRMLS